MTRLTDNAAMPSPHDTPASTDTDLARAEQRITELEIKASFTEDLLDHLNAAIVAQQGQIDLLVREVSALRQQQAEAQPTAFRSLRDDLPPHY